ncbi:MAG: class I SAM-dependent methyltransferase [Candidatus Riflebacteria bacterium]|nr:class I SAM-dependent methyltransferase [Candidatus Riflebacteria bacterium]
MPLSDPALLRAVLERCTNPAPKGPDPQVVATRAGYDRWAELYDDEDNPLIKLEERHLPPLLGPAAGLAVADLGCGTGRWSVRLARDGARVTGVDFSEGMLAKARQKAEGLDLRLVAHDLATPLPLPGQAFDLVLSCLAMEHLPALAVPFAEMARLARPGGRVVVTAMHPAMMLLGVEARFTDPATGRQTRPASARHDIAAYVNAGVRGGLVVETIGEFPVDDELAAASPRARKYLGWPLLLVLAFTRP